MVTKEKLLNYIKRNFEISDEDWNTINDYCKQIDEEFDEPRLIYDVIYEIITEISTFDPEVIEVFENILNDNVKITYNTVSDLTDLMILMYDFDKETIDDLFNMLDTDIKEKILDYVFDGEDNILYWTSHYVVYKWRNCL